jgi:pimeloyl-ACP methyl ester carboxylesterase
MQKRYQGFLTCIFLPLCLVACQQTSSPFSKTVQHNSTEQSHYIRHVGNDAVIVFVHGVVGDATATWTNTETNAYWPALLAKDDTFRDVDVYVHEYNSPYMTSTYSIDQVIEYTRLIFDKDEVFTKHRSVIFICHSMGGLVVRGYLKRYQDKAAQVPLIYFFSTPTAGAHIANLASLLSKNPQLKGMLPADSGSFVSSLQHDWRALNVHPVSKCAYELKDTFGIRVVDEQSATALCDGPVDAINANHLDIVKPKDIADLPYVAFRQAFLLRQAAGVPQPPQPPSVRPPSASPEAIDVNIGIQVWANTDPRSGIYHCPGTRWYGTTRQGEYMTQGQALQRRYRPAYGQYCQ